MSVIKRIKSPIIKNILSVIIITLFGFVLLNLTFILDFLFQGLIDAIVNLFTKTDFNMAWPWFPPLKHGLFVVVIGLVSWLVFKSKLKDIYKATYLTVPTAVILVTIGMSFYRWPVAVYSICGVLVAGILYFFYRTKKPWLYCYAVIIVSLVLLIMNLTGTEI